MSLEYKGFQEGESIDVKIQDQTTKPIIQYFNKKDNTTTLSVATAIDDTSFTVTDVTDFATGKCVVLISTVLNKVMFCNVLSVLGNVVTIDSPIDAIYPVGTITSVGIKDLAVNGSATSQVFGLRNTTEHAELSFDITRIIFTCKTATVGDMSEFGDISGGLTNGIVLRKVDGEYNNIFNVKTNGNMMNIMYDFDILSASNPAQGQNGFKGRLTFAGQNKIGVAIRLSPGEDLQLIIQDDLSSLTGLTAIAEGHLVEE